MPVATIFHNPGAGDEQHSKKKLLTILEENGFECRYSSTKDKKWEKQPIDPLSDCIIIAGGDGTVRKVIGMLLRQPVLDSLLPIGIITLGTANNISKTLGIEKDPETVVKSWKESRLQRFDIGRIFNVPAEEFFIESFGYGLFPYLMMEMKKKKKEVEKLIPDEKLLFTLKLLRDILDKYEPRECNLIIDGKDHSGSYILAEVMNAKSIGPNLELAADNDPADGVFEVVVIRGDEKEKFSAYLQQRINGEDLPYTYHTIRGKDISISWQGTHIHVDDAIVKLEEGETVEIKMRPGLLNFMTGNS